MKKVSDDSVCCIVTSPPYLNNFDYAEMTRMQLYLLGWADGWGQISEKVRMKLVTNTTTAIAGRRGDCYQLMQREKIPKDLHRELSLIVDKLNEQRKERPGKKPYNYLVYPYYAQITRTLAESYRSLTTGGEIHWVISDAALYGVHIETEKHTASIMESLGFKNIKIVKLRERGNRWILSKRDGSKNGLGEYHVIGEK